LLSTLRRRAFWGLDFLKGSPIGKNYGEIENILQDPFGTEGTKMRKARLEGLLEHAVTTVPYFQSYRETRDLQRFPVINKKRIQDHFADFRSKEHLDDKLHKVSTSGSTGMPFTLYHDGQKRSRNLSDVLYFSNASGYTIGNRLIELEVWRSHNTRNNLHNLLQSTVQFDISKLT